MRNKKRMGERGIRGVLGDRFLSIAIKTAVVGNSIEINLAFIDPPAPPPLSPDKMNDVSLRRR